MLHFWYSRKMNKLHEFKNKENNKCIIVLDGEPVELEYTHCHSRYVEAGGCKWGDEVYLGQGVISKYGSRTAWRDPLVNYQRLLELIEEARRIDREEI